MRNSRALAAAIVAVLAVSGCGGEAEQSSATSAANSVAVADQVPEALRFTAPLVGGGTFDGGSVAGRPVAFWFWAPT